MDKTLKKKLDQAVESDDLFGKSEEVAKSMGIKLKPGQIDQAIKMIKKDKSILNKLMRLR